MANTTKKTALGNLPTVRKKTRKLTPAEKKRVEILRSGFGIMAEAIKREPNVKMPD